MIKPLHVAYGNNYSIGHFIIVKRDCKEAFNAFIFSFSAKYTF